MFAWVCLRASLRASDGGRSGRRVEMIPNGSDLELFAPAKRTPLTLPGILPGDFVAGFTGAHGPANDLNAVLDTAAELKRRGRKDIKLVLIGDGKQKEALVARAQRERLDNCLFFPPIKKIEIAQITSSMDCGLQILANVPAFYFGTSPNKFFDYIAAGLPVACNYPGWLAEMIVEQRCGVVARAGDAGSLADQLSILADNRTEAKAMGLRARRLAEQRFDRQYLAARFVAMLETVA